jgi:serine/threonine-protein kinase
MSDVRCAACGTTNPSRHQFCSGCGAALASDDVATMTSPAPPRPAVARPAGDGSRFVPGQVIAERYRMVGLLGRGGMGEVYRADDLKLGQPVALKCLPQDVEADPDRLERFLNEVRLSLRVTHPHVCRVFDIGQVTFAPDGRAHTTRHFLSMEYVDGEDLASLLRRIGRLPEDKAVEIARQLCAGLAAAHDEGVLHRDLKPANIMIDGRGRAKITDFGLASATGGVVGREARVGTPQYMAPEQIEGRELSVQTDLYALGLVLYEVFTGKRAFDGAEVLDLVARRASTPSTPSAHVTGLNPVVDAAIMRCLEPDPARRPKSAAALVAALPGGDPLAIAIAAGETPSPDMVARSGGRGELAPAVAVVCLVAVVASLGLVGYGESRRGLHNRVPLPKPPEELRVAARAALTAAGHTSPAGGSAAGFARDADYFAFVEGTDRSPARWSKLATVEPAPVWYWYRESPRPLAPVSNIESVGIGNPPLIEPGMTRVRVDPLGRLQELRIVPQEKADTPGPYAEPDWGALFAVAGFAREQWAAADPEWPSPDASDVRRAWTKGDLRIEAAAFRGRPVWFRVVPPWRRPAGVRRSSPNRVQQTSAAVVQVMLMLVFVIGVVIARRNLKAGRGDRHGAFRLAAVFVALGTAGRALELPADPASWLPVLSRNVAIELFGGAVCWLSYLTVEPFVRRRWPRALVSWTRVLDGRLRDPMVGRHLLVGAAGGVGFSLISFLPFIASPLLGLPEPTPTNSLAALSSGWARAASLLSSLQSGILVPVFLFLAVFVSRVIFRRSWLAYSMLYVGMGLIVATGGSHVGMQVLNGTLVLTLILVLLTRSGLLALVVAIGFSSWQAVAISADPASWMFPGSAWTMALFAAVAIYGFVVSLGGQRVFRNAIEV